MAQEPGSTDDENSLIALRFQPNRAAARRLMPILAACVRRGQLSSRMLPAHTVGMPLKIIRALLDVLRA
jgi:hypothetical protein